MLLSFIATIFFSRLFSLPRKRPAALLLAPLIVLTIAVFWDQAMFGWDALGSLIAVGTESVRRQFIRASSL